MKSSSRRMGTSFLLLLLLISSSVWSLRTAQEDHHHQEDDDDGEDEIMRRGGVPLEEGDYGRRGGGIIFRASPTLIYRRRLNSDRNSNSRARYQSIYPPLNSIEDQKTEEQQQQGEEEHNTQASTTTSTTSSTEHPSFSSVLRTSKPKKIINKSLIRRRHQNPTSLRLRNNNEEEDQEENPSSTTTLSTSTSTTTTTTGKPLSKSNKERRKKIKKRNKNRNRKPVRTTNLVVRRQPQEQEEDPSTSSGSQGTATNSNNTDKNLALEIGSQDGKYALIDQFFEKDKLAQAPGLLSYKTSPDFPRDDNHKTLGNVKETEIWLSDGHLLVLKGGDLDASLREHWEPIDNRDRKEDKPPLKIPTDSNNPPPFPVYLNDTGPPVFLGGVPFGLPYYYPPPSAFNESFDPSRLPPPGMVPLYPFTGNGSIGGGPPFGPPIGFPPPPPFRRGNGTSILPPPFFHGGVNGNGSRPFFPPPPPLFGNRGNISGFPPPPSGFNGGPPPPPAFFPPLALNPNDNETDDPSIFLPPPYDFDYQEDEDRKSTIVPPGPFAPGLVVPPPKNFYTVINKTKGSVTTTTSPPPTFLYAPGYGNKKPIPNIFQRHNDKKPKFPITNPPDDSEEALQPLVTTPSPPPRKTKTRKQPQKPKQVINNNNNNYDDEYPSLIINNENDNNHLLLNGPTPTISPIRITTPKSNFVYIRGQLKSLAELNAAFDDDEDNRGQVPLVTTPRPPYDERGYPTRIQQQEEPEGGHLFQYQKSPGGLGGIGITPTPHPQLYHNNNNNQYISTPRYNSAEVIYNPPKKTKGKTGKKIANNSQQQLNNLPPPQNNQFLYHGPNPLYQNLYTPAPHFNDNLNIPLIKKTKNKKPSQSEEGIVQLQSPKFTLPQNQQQLQLLQGGQSSVPPNNPTPQSQPQLYNPFINNPYQQQLPPSTGFRPAFGPPQRPQQQQVTSGPIIYSNINPLLYQQQQQNPGLFPDGYFSPLTRYHQPLNNQQNNQYSGDNNNQQNGQYHQGGGGGTTGGLFSTYRQPSPFNQYYQQQQQQTLPRTSDYREQPYLPHYSPSAAVTSRTSSLFKAGPSSTPRPPPGEGIINGDGSYYSFQRGGPGGFSYKIRL